ncbi:MAG: transglutaminase-like domain-containing protein [Rhodospirillaceae bacterium]|nr:transglutaminase-like domain-containing protein [Rhodospirillaceae bacterium]
MTHADDPRAALKRIAAQTDDAIDLAEAALLLAALDHPTGDLVPYREHLTRIADAVHDAAAARHGDDPPGPEDMAAVLNAVLVEEFRYAGDEETYEDLDNANLMRVIERRRGLPVALGILYLSAARAQGWTAAGLNFPNHFLIRLESLDGRRVIVDPFHQGRIMGAPELRELLKVVAGAGVELEAGHYRPVSNRDVLIRLQNNVKSRRLDRGELSGALAAVESMLLLTPDNATLWREAGVLYMRSGQLKRSVESFEAFIARSDGGPDRDKIARVINELRERLN